VTQRNLPKLASTLIAVVLAAEAASCATPAEDRDRDLLAHSESEATGWKGVDLDSQDPLQIAAGREIAEQHCAACHAIDRRSRSPNMDAPPLRDVLAVNDPDRLAYRFIDALRVGHDEMPLFDFDVRSADALIAYLQSISGIAD